MVFTATLRLRTSREPGISAGREGAGRGTMRAMKFLRAGLCAATAGLALGGTAHAEPLKIRGAWGAPVANWASLWLKKKALARHFGQSYIYESVHYAGTPPMITATATNELEIADLAYSTVPIAIENAGMDDL